jgi:hypothetical protein
VPDELVELALGHRSIPTYFENDLALGATENRFCWIDRRFWLDIWAEALGCVGFLYLHSPKFNPFRSRELDAPDFSFLPAFLFHGRIHKDMAFLKDLISKQRYPVILLLAGICLMFLGCYSLSGELLKPQVKPVPTNAVFVGLGVLAIVGSGTLFVLDEDFIAYRRGCKIRSSEFGFETTFRDSELGVCFGVLQDLYDPSDQGSVVVLPANEFFDERCFQDGRTSAGAFISKYFPQEANALKELVDHELRLNHSRNIVMVGDKKSYGVGTCIYLPNPLGRAVRIILAAVASDRDPHGLRTELSTVFRVVEEVKCIIANQRLSRAYIPLLGAGKGGVPAEIAFLTLVSAFLEARCKDGGHHLKAAHLVIFKRPDREPEVSSRRAKRSVRQLVSLYQEMSR